MADTTSVITTGSGERTQVATVPTTILTRGQAVTLAEYRNFLNRYTLDEAIYCRTCYASGAREGAKIARGTDQIGVMCPHHVWFSQGALPIESLESPITAPSPIVLTDAPAETFVTLSVDEAKLLRAYKRILEDFGWVEGLDCQTCHAEGSAAGCRAFVTDTRIAIICRHRTLQFIGQTS